MPYYVEVNVDDEWTAVIDMNLSKYKAVKRVFMTEEAANNFRKKEIGGDIETRVVEIEYE